MSGRGKCRRPCHLVWSNPQHGIVVISCAHCWNTPQKLDLSETYDDELIARQIAASRAGHLATCRDKRRSPSRR